MIYKNTKYGTFHISRKIRDLYFSIKHKRSRHEGDAHDDACFHVTLRPKE